LGVFRAASAQPEPHRPHLVEQPHDHPWPVQAEDWGAVLHCRTCGLALLRAFFDIADWVVRRVESIEFVDDRTIRRRVSVDYTVPHAAVMLRRADGTVVRVLPLALMRRKSIINFDFRDHDGRPMPLPGLRENQALTLSAVRASAATLLEDRGVSVPDWPALPGDLGTLLDPATSTTRASMPTSGCGWPRSSRPLTTPTTRPSCASASIARGSRSPPWRATEPPSRGTTTSRPPSGGRSIATGRSSVIRIVRKAEAKMLRAADDTGRPGAYLA
jgi:hypothetical protein